MNIMGHELQEYFASIVDEVMREALVTVSEATIPIFSTAYEGDVTAGAVKIPYRADMKVGNYDKTTGGTKTHGSTAYITVTDFKDQYVNEVIDGYDAAGVPDDIIADRLGSAGYAGALALEEDAVTVLVAEGTTLNDTVETTKLTAYSVLNSVRGIMSKAKVPTSLRFCLASPDFYGKILEDPEFVKAGNVGQAIVQNGFVGKCAGFWMFECNTLPDGVEFICGHYKWCHRVRAWVVEPRVQSLDGSGDYIGAVAVQGRWIHKHRVSNAAAVYVKTAVDVVAPEVKAVTGVVITNNPLALAPGETEQITYTIAPVDASDDGVTFRSSNNNIATVDTTGLVTAINDGSVVITVVTDDGNFADSVVCTVATPIAVVTGQAIADATALDFTVTNLVFKLNDTDITLDGDDYTDVGDVADAIQALLAADVNTTVAVTASANKIVLTAAKGQRIVIGAALTGNLSDIGLTAGTTAPGK